MALAKAHVDNYKMNKGCARCGFNEHPVALEFDHIDPSKKSKTVSQLVKKGVMKNIISEIEKCQVLCSNCHRIHTYANKHHMNTSEVLDE